MIRPTRLLLALGGTTVPVSVLLVSLREDLWIGAAAFTVSLLTLAVVDAQSSRLKSRLRVEPRPPGHFYINEPNALTLNVSGGGPAKFQRLEILLDADPSMAKSQSVSLQCDEAGSASVSIPIDVLRRGLVPIDSVWIRWRSALGLNTHVVRLPLNLKIAALPNIVAVRRAAVLYHQRGSIFGVKPQQDQGDGSDFDALREYRPGINLRAIDWKHSAKHLQLVSKEFRVEQNHHIIVALDTGYLMREPLKGVAKLDRAINASLILSYQALAEGDRVGLFAFDSAVRLYQSPVAGSRAFPQIQKALSELDYSIEETNFTLGLSTLTTRLNRRALIVILTDYVDSIQAQLMIENIERLAKRHLVMFVALKDVALETIANASPSSLDAAARSITAADILRERRLVLDRLTRLGVSAFDADPETFDSAIVSRYLKIKQRELI